MVRNQGNNHNRLQGEWGMKEGGFWRYENRLIAIMLLTFGFVFFDRNAYGYLAPFIVPELGLNNTQHGMIVSGLSLTWALSAIFIGMVSDSSGKRKSLLLIAVTIFSLCSVMSGMAGSFLILILARMLMGVSEGGIMPIMQSLVVLESSDERRGLNMGVTQNLGSNLLGSFAAPLVLVWFANLDVFGLGWRAAFYLAAIPGFIMAFFIWRYVREPETHEIRTAAVPDEPEQDKMGALAMFKQRNIWLCTVISCFMVAWMVLGWSFLPLFFTEARGIASSDMSVLMSLLGISAGVCAFIVPGLSDRFGRKPVVVMFNLIGILTPLAGLYFTDSLVLLGILMVVGWSASGTFPIFMGTIPSETIPVRYVATSLGLVMGTGELIGGVLSPTGAGNAADVFGLDAPIWIMAGCALVGGVLSMFLRETAPVKMVRKVPAA